jgi:pimeloyl-ACP methyl ester carboxylesterase
MADPPDTGADLLRHTTFIRPDRGTMHCVATGTDGPPVVLLHGLGDSWRSFEAMFPVLGARFRLLAPDQRGHGDSDPAATYTIADFTADAIAFIQRAAAPPVYLIGHSLGGIVAQRIAASRPDLVCALVLISTAPTAAGHPGLREFLVDLTALGQVVPREAVESFQAGTVFRPIPPARFTALIEESVKLTSAAWRGATAGLLEEPATEHPAIAVPTLALWGTRDGIFDAASQAALALAIPGLTAIAYDDVGHAPNWEVPDRAGEDIVAFFDKVGTLSGGLERRAV